MTRVSEFEAKLKALERAVDKAKQMEAFVAKNRKAHGVYQVGLSKGVAKGLEDALHIMSSKERQKSIIESDNY